MDPNRSSQVIVIEDDVIDLDDGEKTHEEIIYDWDAEMRKKLALFSLTGNDNLLGDLMKDYFQSLQDIINCFDNNDSLRSKVYCHISFLYSYYVELQCCSSDNYLNNMEEILTCYCNLEMSVIRPLKKKNLGKQEYNKRLKVISKRIIYILTLYLLERHDHMLHVLIKMNVGGVSDMCLELSHILYKHFLTKVPVPNNYDETFCRNYILIQKWKEICKVDDWQKMDRMMYALFHRTPDSIKSNETLKRILMPCTESSVDIVLQLFHSYRDIASAYFKHIVSKKCIVMKDLDFSNLDLDEDELLNSTDDEDDEEIQLKKLCVDIDKKLADCGGSSQNAMDSTCKQEDDDVQFIGVTILETVNHIKDTKSKLQATNLPCFESTAPLPTPPPKLTEIEKNNGITNFHESLTEVDASCSSKQCTLANDAEKLQESTSISENLHTCTEHILESTNQTPCVDTSRSIETATILSQLTTHEILTDIETQCCVDSSAISGDSKRQKNCTVQETECYVDLDVPSSIPETIVNENEMPPLKNNFEHNPENMKSESTCVINKAAETLQAKVPFSAPKPSVSQPELSAIEPEATLTNPEAGETERRSGLVEASAPHEEFPKYIGTTNKCLYNDYGLTTPPFEVLSDDHHPSPEPCVYPNIVANHNHLNKYLHEKDDAKSDNAQVRESDSYDDCGLTPPTDIPIEDASSTGVYQNIGHNRDSSAERDEDYLNNSFESEHGTAENVGAGCKPEILPNTKRKDECEDLMDVQEIDAYFGFSHDQCDIDIESESRNQINTGQRINLSTEQQQVVNNNRHGPKSTQLTKELLNGNTVLKPLQSVNRTNGQKDNQPKILYTTSQTTKVASMSDFTQFEKAIWNKMKENNEFEDLLSGPVTKVTPIKHNILSVQEESMFNTMHATDSITKSVASRPSSPLDVASPSYDPIDEKDVHEFRTLCSEKVIKRNTVPVNPPMPRSILRKTVRVERWDSSDDEFSVRQRRRIETDLKLQQQPRVVLERLSFIERKIKEFNNLLILRVDYDKNTTGLNSKDMVRFNSPPRITFRLKSKDITGPPSVKLPMKRKAETSNSIIDESTIRRKRGRQKASS